MRSAAFDAWLLMRGMRTLDIRVRGAGQDRGDAGGTAGRASSSVARCSIPACRIMPATTIALRQMSGGFGGMFSVRIKNGEHAAIAVAAAVELWKRATSFGGIESLIEHRASIEGEGSPCPGDLLRFSAGLEDADELYLDLIQALSAIA